MLTTWRFRISPTESHPQAGSPSPADGRSAAEVLAWSRGLVAPGLREAVERLAPSVRHVAGYHFGWWDAVGGPIDAPAGKGIRPALALVCARAVGAPAEVAVPAAVAVELVHNFSLLHDDVMDGDETRRHRPTAWRVFGVGSAILAGDALLTLAMDVVSAPAGATGAGGGAGPDGSPGGPGAQLLQTLSRTVQELIDGQMADLSFEARPDVSLGECLDMAAHKTGALLRAACRLGAQAGGGRPEEVGALTSYGADLGLAFQVADDLQGIWGDPARTGKADYSDLRNRKKSLPVVAALESGTAAGAELRAWFCASGEPGAADVGRVAALVEQGGGRSWAEARLASLHASAVAALEGRATAPAAVAELTALLALVTAVP